MSIALLVASDPYIFADPFLRQAVHLAGQFGGGAIAHLLGSFITRLGETLGGYYPYYP